MLTVMAGSFLVPKKDVEISSDDYANQTKTFFLNSSYISHYFEACFFNQKHRNQHSVASHH